MEEVPGNYKTAGILMLVAGIFNILVGISITFAILINVLATMGMAFPCLICCIWVPVPIGFGVYEIMTGMKAMNGTPVKNASTVSIIGIVLAALSASFVGMILEIVATVMLNDDEVKVWIEQNDPELLA